MSRPPVRTAARRRLRHRLSIDFATHPAMVAFFRRLLDEGLLPEGTGLYAADGLDELGSIRLAVTRATADGRPHRLDQ